MRVVIQRVKHASVTVDEKIISKIGNGLLVLVGFDDDDTDEDFEWMTNKIIELRDVFDEDDMMNISVESTKGEILVVSQVTLHASVKKGNRPSYIKASKPEQAKNQYEEFVKVLQNKYLSPIQTGEFGADMKVELLNDGPITICI